MADDIEQQAAVIEEVDEVEDETPEPEPSASTDWEARAKKLEEKAIAQRERTRMLKQEIEKLKKATAPKPEAKATTGELDETQSLFLEVKGITEDDEVALVQQWQKESGKGLKAIVTSKIFQAELKELRDEKAVKAATPSSTRRSGQAETTDVGAHLAKYEATGELPKDFEMRAKVIELKEARESDNTPPWLRK